MIGYLFVNKDNEIRTITGRNMPEVYFSRKEAAFVKPNYKADYNGWTVARCDLFVAKKMPGSKHVPREDKDGDHYS